MKKPTVLDSLAARGRVRVSGFVIRPDHVHAVLWVVSVREKSVGVKIEPEF
jgi:REP element-mobilizing transposase RayT